jgi:MFS family permease
VFIVDGATSGVVAVLLYLILDHDEPTTSRSSLRAELTRWAGAVGEPRLVHLAVLNVGFAVLYAQMQSTVPVFATRAFGLSSAQLGTLYVLNPLVLVLFQLPVVAYVAGWRRTRGLLLSTGFWAASFAAIIIAHYTSVVAGIVLVGGFLVLRTVGEVLHSPLATALASDLGPAETRGSQLSVVEVSKRLGFGLGNLVGGAFFDYGLEPWLWPAMVILAIAVGAGILALEGRLTPAENGVAA